MIRRPGERCLPLVNAWSNSDDARRRIEAGDGEWRGVDEATEKRCAGDETTPNLITGAQEETCLTSRYVGNLNNFLKRIVGKC